MTIEEFVMAMLALRSPLVSGTEEQVRAYIEATLSRLLESEGTRKGCEEQPES